MNRSSDHTFKKRQITSARKDELHGLETQLGFRFNDLFLLDEAFTHRSFRNENNIPYDNERLEFLGDSVLSLLVNHYLFEQFPQSPEGELAAIKSKVVSEPALARIADRLSLSRYLQFGKGELETGGRDKRSNKANLVEAVLGALYLDKGLAEAEKFLIKEVESLVKNLNSIESVKDYKTRLQEYCQQKMKTLPRYRLLEEKGPDHEKEFLIEVSVDGLGVETAKGNTKRKAEQIAASKLLEKL